MWVRGRFSGAVSGTVVDCVILSFSIVRVTEGVPTSCSTGSAGSGKIELLLASNSLPADFLMYGA